jgi:cell division protein FtsN
MAFYRKVDDHYEMKVDQGRVVILSIGAGLLIALLFLVGILVGKTLWGTQPEELALLRAAQTPPEQAATSPVEFPEKTRYTFYQDVKRPAGEEEPPPPPPRPVETSEIPGPGALGTIIPKRPASELAGAVPTAAPTAVSPPVAPADAAVAAPEPEAPTEAKPQSRQGEKIPGKSVAVAEPAPVAEKPAQVSSGGAYAVQVCSYRERDKAAAVAKKLSDKGMAAEIVSARVNGQEWYRVRTGRFATKAEADRFNAESLKPKGFGGFIVPR